MKWFSFIVVAFTAMNLFFPIASFSESEHPVTIESISHSKDSDAKEMITFKLAEAVVPKIFILRGENPRLVIDFPETIYWGKNVIGLTESNLASTIRIGLHRIPVKRTRIVVDLSKEKSVQYTSEYLTQENRLIVTLSSDITTQQSNTSTALQPQSQNVSPSKEELSAGHLDENPIPPISAVNNAVEAAAKGKIVDPVVPTILKISFDDSSSKGEMVLFRLNDFFPPVVSAIEKDIPRILCDFQAMDLAPDVQMTIVTNGKYIERIRTAKHQDPEKVRVVLDLSPDRDYDLKQVFFRNDNLFVLIVNELPPNKVADSAEKSGTL